MDASICPPGLVRFVLASLFEGLSVRPSVRMSVRPLALKENRQKQPKIAGKHYDFILIHIERIYMLGQACCFPNAIKH